MSLNNLTPSQLALLDDPKWRKKNSRWRHIVWWSAGVYGGAALIYVAARSKSKRAIMAAGVSVALFVAIAAVQSQLPLLSDSERAALEGTSRVATPLENVSSAIIMAMIAFNIWMSFYLQKDWLLWVVNKNAKASWVEQKLNVKTIKSNPGAQPSAASQPTTVGGLSLGDSSEFIEPISSGNQAVPEETILEVLDLNTASKQEMMRVPGVDEPLASRIVQVRDSRGHFRNFEDFSISLSLKPHEARKFEGRFAFLIPNGGSSSGRILDV